MTRMPQVSKQDWTVRESVLAWEVRSEEGIFAIVSVPLESSATRVPLTEAESDIVRHILRGESNKTIAIKRGTAVRTVANQIAAIYQKLGIASRAELVAHVSRLRFER